MHISITYFYIEKEITVQMLDTLSNIEKQKSVQNGSAMVFFPKSPWGRHIEMEVSLDLDWKSAMPSASDGRFQMAPWKLVRLYHGLQFVTNKMVAEYK